MGFPGVGDLGSFYIPPPVGALELNLNDEWRARFTEADELPPNAPVQYGYAIVFKGDRGYVCRAGDDAVWGVVEGPFSEGEQTQEWLERAVREQLGATIAKCELFGYLDCKATSHNPQFEAGAVTVRALYLVAAEEVGEIPDDSPYARRRLPLNEHARAVRDRYPELVKYMSIGLNRYNVWRAKGEA
ncbi:MAG: hypothetical protein IT303_07655 [Dehalococcoidia bacterium]|nr:hypothetical protein [Dehalococcoidia bacterium]